MNDSNLVSFMTRTKKKTVIKALEIFDCFNFICCEFQNSLSSYVNHMVERAFETICINKSKHLQYVSTNSSKVCIKTFQTAFKTVNNF